MWTAVDIAPRSWCPAHADTAPNCDRFDQGAPAIINGSHPVGAVLYSMGVVGQRCGPPLRREGAAVKLPLNRAVDAAL
jgi:hypothetical protein